MMFLLWGQGLQTDDLKWLADISKKPLDKETVALIEQMQENRTCCGSTKQAPSSDYAQIPFDDITTQKKDTLQIFAFMSYSIPEQTWKDLSKQLNQYNQYTVQCVIRGLPEDSFKLLSEKIMSTGCPVMIHPDLFEKYHITKVPAFLFVKGDRYEGVYGNVSLDYAVRYLQEQGNGLVRESLI